MMRKNSILGIAILTIITVIFNVIAFLLPETRSGTFWCGYIFTMIALLSQPLFFYTAFGNSISLKKTFLGISIAQCSVGYLTIQGIWGTVCLFAPAINVKIAVVISVVLLGFYLIAVISATLGRDVASDIDTKIKVKTFFIKSMLVDVETLVAKTDNSEIKIELNKLIETVKYSDPMSNQALANVESRISDKYSELEQAAISDNFVGVISLCKDINALFIERDKKCKLLK